jgi:hypothetical protein
VDSDVWISIEAIQVRAARSVSRHRHIADNKIASPATEVKARLLRIHVIYDLMRVMWLVSPALGSNHRIDRYLVHPRSRHVQAVDSIRRG